MEKYPYRVETDKFMVLGNKKRLVIIYKDPAYILPNGQWYTKTDAAGFTITGSKTAKTASDGSLQKRLMRHSAEVHAVCFSIGGGIFLKVGNAHRPDYTNGKNWWDQDPFSLKFWNEGSRKNLGSAIEVQFNLGDRQIWVKNPLEIDKFMTRDTRTTDIQEQLVLWGEWAGLCGTAVLAVEYKDQYNYGSLSSAFTPTASGATTESTTGISLSMEGKHDFRVFQMLKTVFYPGVVTLRKSIGVTEWGTSSLRLVGDASDFRKRKLYKCKSVGDIVEMFTGRRPKTLIKAFSENMDILVSDLVTDPYSGYRSEQSNVTVFDDKWVKVANELLKAEVPIEFVVQMVPYMKSRTRMEYDKFVSFFLDIVKEVGPVKVINMLERSEQERMDGMVGRPIPPDADEVEQLYHALQAGPVSSMLPMDYLIEGSRMFSENKEKMKHITPRQKKVFPNGLVIRRYYKTAKELHDDLSQQATKFAQLGDSTIIKWDKLWYPIHGASKNGLRILLPRSTGTVARWGKDQRHCISTYAHYMVGTRYKNGYQVTPETPGDADGAVVERPRTILAGVFKGSELLYCMRMEHDRTLVGTPVNRSEMAVHQENPGLIIKEIPWKLEEFRGLQNAAPDDLHAKDVCDILDRVGIHTGNWRQHNLKNKQEG